MELVQDDIFLTNTIVILLNGLIQTDDRMALKSATKQMNLEREVEGKTFSSFSENLTFLLSCLKTGNKIAFVKISTQNTMYLRHFRKRFAATDLYHRGI